MPVPASVTPATLGAILTALGLNPKLTISVQIRATEVTAEFIRLDDAGILVRSSGDDVIHQVRIPVQEAPEPAPEPEESP